MTDTDEILETEIKGVTTIPMVVKILSVLSYIGFGMLALGLTIAVLFAFSKTQPRLASFGIGINTYIVVYITIIVLFSILAIIGAVWMHQGQKRGFVIYSVGAGLFALSQFFVGEIEIQRVVMGAVSLTFIIAFATQLKHLN